MRHKWSVHLTERTMACSKCCNVRYEYNCSFRVTKLKRPGYQYLWPGAIWLKIIPPCTKNV